MIRVLLILLLTASLCFGGRSTSVDSVEVEGELDWGDSFARDIGVSAAGSDAIVFGFGDTLSDQNSDGTVCSNSVARAPISTPIELSDLVSCSTNADQSIAYTEAEATWNLEGVGEHPYRWGLPIMGAVSEPNDATRFFYVLDRPLFGGGGGFYDRFPMEKIGTCVLPDGDAVCPRNTGAEIDLPNEADWPVGFHRVADGSVRFFLQRSVDGVVWSDFRRARWTEAGGFVFGTNVAFKLDAAFGLWPFYSTRQKQWLATYIDQRGRIRLTALTGKITGSDVLYTIPGWSDNWDGYTAVRIDGADESGGAEFLVTYSVIGGGFLAGEMPVIRVTLD